LQLPHAGFLSSGLMQIRNLATLLACGAGILIAGCGSAGKADSASTKQGAAATTQASTTSSVSTSTTKTSASGSETIATLTLTSTRTSSAPAFAKQESGQSALAAAVASVQSQGYTPKDTAEYHPQQTLRVLTAARSGAGGAYVQRAFFFIDERYIGTDSSQPSGSVKVISQGQTSVTLAYGMYRAGDSPCCPGGGQSTVTFQLNNGSLQALDPIPAAHSASGLSRL
jgi:hypothetical protein